MIHDGARGTKDERCKHDSLVLYDPTKVGIDVVDLVLTHNTTRIKHKSSCSSCKEADNESASSTKS